MKREPIDLARIPLTELVASMRDKFVEDFEGLPQWHHAAVEAVRAGLDPVEFRLSVQIVALARFARHQVDKADRLARDRARGRQLDPFRARVATAEGYLACELGEALIARRRAYLVSVEEDASRRPLFSLRHGRNLVLESGLTLDDKDRVIDLRPDSSRIDHATESHQARVRDRALALGRAFEALSEADRRLLETAAAAGDVSHTPPDGIYAALRARLDDLSERHP